jgi:hypothetical protein
VPVASAALTGVVFVLARGALAGSVPWFVLPFLPPAVLALLIGVLEGRRLAKDVAFLVAQLRGVSAPPGGSG